MTSSTIVILISGLVGTLCASDTRGLIPEQFVKARPAGAKSKVSGAPVYRPMSAQTGQKFREGGSPAQVGITVWRLRRAQAADSGARILVHRPESTEEWVPERLSSSAKLVAGDRVRITIESPVRGYLYVIDRERYQNGEYGKPYLIFPTGSLRGGDNAVDPGKLIDIPGQNDQPNVFELKQSRLGQTGEELTVLVTSSPLDLETAPKEQILPDATFLSWVKQWERTTEIFELVDGGGKAWTPAEQQAAADGTRRLTQEDPPPQTIYRASVKSGDPLLVKLDLRYAK